MLIYFDKATLEVGKKETQVINTKSANRKDKCSWKIVLATLSREIDHPKVTSINPITSINLLSSFLSNWFRVYPSQIRFYLTQPHIYNHNNLTTYIFKDVQSGCPWGEDFSLEIYFSLKVFLWFINDDLFHWVYWMLTIGSIISRGNH